MENQPEIPLYRNDEDGSNLLQMEHLSAGTEDWPLTVTLPGGNTIELTGIWKY